MTSILPPHKQPINSMHVNVGTASECQSLSETSGVEQVTRHLSDTGPEAPPMMQLCYLFVPAGLHSELKEAIPVAVVSVYMIWCMVERPDAKLRSCSLSRLQRL